MILILTLILGVFLWQKNPAAKLTQNQKSEVRIINGIPKIFVGGKQLDTGVAAVFNFPKKDKNVPAYESAEWLDNMKMLVDRAAFQNNRILIVRLWWFDFDKSASRPQNIGDNLNFGPMDSVFDYAAQRGVYIMPQTILWPNYPDWWLKENNIPPYNKEKACDFCETDSYGNVYSNPSMNSDKTHEDYGAFLKAVIAHYKNHPALIGWERGVGATDEDNYGPNYIDLYLKENLKNVGDEKKQSMRYTDYSPYFEKKFKEWLQDKYKTDQDLQKAWNNNSVSFNSFKIPRPKEMFVSGVQAPEYFPDPGGTTAIFLNKNGESDTSLLNQTGLDFYDFRNYMRQADRRFYSNLIKKSDPDHILIINGTSNEFLDQITKENLADGIIWNLPAPRDKFEEGIMNFLGTDVVKRAVAKGKIPIIPEDGFDCGEKYECENADQLFFVENVGKSIKCAGGIFGPTYGPYDENYIKKPGNWTGPIWYSNKILSAAEKIAGYKPGKNCMCPLVSEIIARNKCDTDPQGKGCESLSKTAKAYNCNSKSSVNLSNENSKNNQPTGKCGDGICDNIEKTSGACPTDCP